MEFHWKFKRGLALCVLLCALINVPQAYSAKLSFPSDDTDTTTIITTENYRSSEIVNPRSLKQAQLQARSESLCNCTSLFQCDLGGNSEEKDYGENETDHDENGADTEIIDIRNGLPSSSTSNFQCAHYLEICCNRFQEKQQSESKPPTTTINRESVPKENRHKCGIRNVQGVGFRIVGGIEGEAQMGEFTWMIAVTELNKRRPGTVYLCGGSLIHPRVVLTAAHCLENTLVENLIVRAGEWDTQTEREDPYSHYDRHVNETIIHEEYSKKKVLKNDIALIVLSKDVPLARHVGTVCLTPDLKPPAGSNCVASGWGKNLYGKEGSYQSILKKIDLPIISQSSCQERFQATRLGPDFRLHRSFVCAGGERGKGDGGSPLVCQIPGSLGRYAQYGIVSWGLNCGEPIPGAYANVPMFIPWIERQFRKLGLDPSSFMI